MRRFAEATSLRPGSSLKIRSSDKLRKCFKSGSSLVGVQMHRVGTVACDTVMGHLKIMTAHNLLVQIKPVESVTDTI